MKTFCEVCTTNPAALVCCADDAVMCGSCDESIHSANPVVQKHERVAFKSTAAKPNCDICQVNPVYVVCHEDRAFLCRSCDISIHSANAHVAKHQRFLMTGVSLELEAVGAAAKEGEVAETPVVAQAPMAKKAKGIKRKMEHQFQAPSASSEDGLVPSMGGAEAAADPMASEEEFNSFVQDFLGNTKEGKDGNMADFLDNFFDDIPAVGNDFGVVPVM